MNKRLDNMEASLNKNHQDIWEVEGRQNTAEAKMVELEARLWLLADHLELQFRAVPTKSAHTTLVKYGAKNETS